MSTTEIPRCLELRYRSGVVEHTVLPPHDGIRYSSTTQPFAFGVSFTGHHEAVVRTDRGTLHSRSFRPGAVGINGARPLHWMYVAERSEGVEIHPSHEIIDTVARQTGCDWAGVDTYRQAPFDPIVWGAAVAFRAAAAGRIKLPPGDAAGLITNVTTHVAIHHFGGAAPRAFSGRLSLGLVMKVQGHLWVHRERPVTLAELSSVVSMSEFHLHRSFRRTVGLTPATFAMAMRMEHAHRLIEAGSSVRDAAEQVGMADSSYFRRSYRRFFDDPPARRS